MGCKCLGVLVIGVAECLSCVFPLLLVVFCLMRVGCLLYVVCGCSLYVVCCLLFVVDYCLLFVGVWTSLCVGRS